MIHVNDTTINDEPNVAFGGEKQSGLGRLNGEWSLEEFTTLKWISVQHKTSIPILRRSERNEYTDGAANAQPA